MSKKRFNSYYPKVYSDLVWSEGMSEYREVFSVYLSKGKYFDTTLDALRCSYPEVMKEADEIAAEKGDNFNWREMIWLLVSEGYIPTAFSA